MNLKPLEDALDLMKTEEWRAMDIPEAILEAARRYHQIMESLDFGYEDEGVIRLRYVLEMSCPHVLEELNYESE